MRLIVALSVAGMLLTGASATAGPSAPHEPDIVVGTCSVCHGHDGISPTAKFPNLAAQTEPYLETQLQNFRNHQRGDYYAKAYMWTMAGTLSDKTIKQIAEYFSALQPAKGATNEDAGRVAAGKTIFEQGITSENVPACGVCHGATATGTTMAPRLAGQHSEYLVVQLQAFRDNTRDNAIMHANVAQMTDQQMREIAAYLASL